MEFGEEGIFSTSSNYSTPISSISSNMCSEQPPSVSTYYYHLYCVILCLHIMLHILITYYMDHNIQSLSLYIPGTLEALNRAFNKELISCACLFPPYYRYYM